MQDPRPLIKKKYDRPCYSEGSAYFDISQYIDALYHGICDVAAVVSNLKGDVSEGNVLKVIADRELDLSEEMSNTYAALLVVQLAKARRRFQD